MASGNSLFLIAGARFCGGFGVFVARGCVGHGGGLGGGFSALASVRAWAFGLSLTIRVM